MDMTQDAAWQAIETRDRRADGRFVFAVVTTGIYCRPSCPARRPKRNNARLFADGAVAREAGFRACLRCAPDDASRDEQAIALALTLIRAADGVPTLGDLAIATGYSPTHFQRIFARATGLSPAAYGRACRMERARDALAQTERVTDGLYDAGFAAPSRFYAAAGDRLGMTPSAWARGGAGVTIRWTMVATSFGPMVLAATDKGVCRLAFGGGRDDLATRFPHATLVEGGAALTELAAQVVAAVEAPGSSPAIPLDVRGTAFQEAVWRELQRIPPGETRSYAQIAAAIGRPRATRAAGTANGANPVAVLIPCHRVIRGDGSPGGYAWGLEIKAALLAREGAYTKE
jgi:AraC family transcriptional regulator of adaptative response/methylated-DNA-[protein]-cysteine methyltransferase